MIDTHPIVSQDHALLRPGLTITDDLISAMRDAVLGGEDIDVARVRTVHGDEAAEALAREMGEVGRG